MSNESQAAEIKAAADESFLAMLEYVEVNFPEDVEAVNQADRELLYRVFHSGFGYGQRFEREAILELLKREGVDFEVVTTPIQ